MYIRVNAKYKQCLVYAKQSGTYKLGLALQKIQESIRNKVTAYIEKMMRHLR